MYHRHRHGARPAAARKTAGQLRNVASIMASSADDARANRRGGLYTSAEMLGIMAMVGVLTAVAVTYGSTLLGAPAPTPVPVPAVAPHLEAALAAAQAAHRAELASITSRMNEMTASMSALVTQLALAPPACNCPTSSAAAPPAAVPPPQNSATFDSGAGGSAPVSRALDTKAGNSTALPDVDIDGRPNRFGIDDLNEKFNVKVAHRVVCRSNHDF